MLCELKLKNHLIERALKHVGNIRSFDVLPKPLLFLGKHLGKLGFVKPETVVQVLDHSFVTAVKIHSLDFNNPKSPNQNIGTI